MLAASGCPRPAPGADPGGRDEGGAVLLAGFAVDAPHGGGVLRPGDHLLNVHALRSFRVLLAELAPLASGKGFALPRWRMIPTATCANLGRYTTRPDRKSVV